MKVLSVIWLCLILFLYGCKQQTNQRYQFGGPEDTMMLDTATGKVWQLRSKSREGKYEYWFRMMEVEGLWEHTGEDLSTNPALSNKQ